ncbi:MAG: Gfo/Idh/MocA family oxidoreductase [Treponema sp.]|nr:Gfo/Idh/MocA family oxidoreductase [Treponema sp.]
MSFKICVIGCGGIAFQMHGYAYKKYAALNSGTVLSACCDIDINKASGFAKTFGFQKHYTDYREMLKTEKPDAVCLNSPVNLTAAMSCEILDAGFHLMLEKPPGRNRGEIEKILEAAQRAGQKGIIHQVAFNRRFIPVIDCLVRELRADNKPQDIQSISCEFFRVNRRDPDFCTTAIHGIDTAAYIAGSNYRQVNFYYREMADVIKGCGDFYLLAEFYTGACAQLRFCPMSAVRLERYTVNAGDSTWIALLPYGDSIDSPGRLLCYRGDKLVSEVTGQEICGSDEIFMTNGFWQEDSAFFDAVRAARQPACDLNSGLQSVEISDCIRKREREYCSN